MQTEKNRKTSKYGVSIRTPVTNRYAQHKHLPTKKIKALKKSSEEQYTQSGWKKDDEKKTKRQCTRLGRENKIINYRVICHLNGMRESKYVGRKIGSSIFSFKQRTFLTTKYLKKKISRLFCIPICESVFGAVRWR